MQIITPANLKTILSNIINHLNTDKIKIQSTRHTVSVTEDKTTIEIGISGFNKQKNTLQVFKDGKLLKESQYIISEDNLSITGTFTGATTEAPVEYEFIVMKVSL